jgi:hypothetical protein
MKPENLDGENNADTVDSTLADAAIQQLTQTRKIWRLYPPGNPYVKTSLANLRSKIASFTLEDPLHIDIECESLLYKQTPILSGDEGARDLAHTLYLMHAGSVVLDPDVSEMEIATFLSLINLTPDEQRTLGPFDEALTSRGVERIRAKLIGEVKVEEVGGGESHPWDIVSLAELEEIEAKLLGELGKTSFKDTLRTVDGELDPRASRILGLLGNPSQFATFLLQLASRRKVNRASDLGEPLEFIITMIRHLEPFIEKIQEADRIRLYEKLKDALLILANGIDSQLLHAQVPPFLRLKTITPFVQERVPGMTAHEALAPDLRFHPAMSCFLLGGLRRAAAGNSSLLALLDIHEPPLSAPDEGALASYRPVVEPPALPIPLKQEFFVPSRGALDFGEASLLQRASLSIGVFDSISALMELLSAEENSAAYGKLLEILVNRFYYCLEVRNLEMCTYVLGALRGERQKRTESPEFLKLIDASILQCGELEPMRAYVSLLVSCEKQSKEYVRTAELLKGLRENAIRSLVEILAVEPDKSKRHRILAILAQVGHNHIDLFASYRSHSKWYVVRNILWILGRLGPEALPRILGVGVHQEPRVRRETVRSLGLIGGPEAIKRLIFYLRDKNEAVLRESVRQLVKLRSEECLPVLHTIMLAPDFQDKEADTGITLAQALGFLGREDSLNVLQSLLDAKTGKGKAYSAEVQDAFRQALEAIRLRLSEKTS